MLKTTAIAAATLSLALTASIATAAPAGVARDHPAAGATVVEQAQAYHRNCQWLGTGWGHHSGGKVLVCKPHKPAGHWVWHHSGPKHGWYNPHRKEWHHKKW